jgi:hypothetical protein
MKSLQLIFLIVFFLNAKAQVPTISGNVFQLNFKCKDSIWDTFEYSKGKYDIDSTDWMLYKIEKDDYFYFKSYSFGTVNEKGWGDAVAYYERSYRKTNWLLKNCEIQDTIPKPMNIVNWNPDKQEWTYYKEYRVGKVTDFLGEFVYSKIDSIVKVKQ